MEAAKAANTKSAAADLAKLNDAAAALRGKLEDELAVKTRTVQSIQLDFGAFDPKLVEALVEQGRVLHALSRYGQAVDAYERARHITRVNDGLYNIRQIEIIDATADSLAAASRWREATYLKDYALMLARRQYGADNPELVPALYSLGNWYERSGNVFGAREMYEAAGKILADHVGDSDARRADALRRLAYAYRLERFPEHQYIDEDKGDYAATSDLGPTGVHPLHSSLVVNRFGPGERALKDAIRIYDRQTPPDAKRVAETLAELGDWYLLFGMWDRALQAYREAINQSGDPKPLFGIAQTIYWRPPLSPERPPDDTITERHGFVEMTFDVSEKGEVTKAEVARAAPAGLMETKALKALRASRYRPRFDGAGQPLATVGVKFRYEFVYYLEPHT